MPKTISLSRQSSPLPALFIAQLLLIGSVDLVTAASPQERKLVEQALEADDDKLQTAFDKLEGDLWVIPEAIDKPSALELLKSKYPSFDDKTISSLYEELKGGLYQARNRALSPIGDVKRRIQEDEQRQGSRGVTSSATSLRMTLMRIKNDQKVRH